MSLTAISLHPGGKQGVNLGDKQGGCQGCKVKAVHLHLLNSSCTLHLTVPTFHAMMHGCHISCQNMGFLFAPVMLNTG